MQLPADERLALATELLDSVEGREDPAWAAAWAAELDRRVKALDNGTAKSIPWEQVKADIEAPTGKMKAVEFAPPARDELDAAVD